MNFAILATFAVHKIRHLRDQEEGLALTEYLVLLGLLVGGVITAVGLFGTGLSTTWTAWTNWLPSLTPASIEAGL